MESYSYRIDRRPDQIGGGWRLQLLQNGVEVAMQVFPVGGNDAHARRQAYVDALNAAQEWLASHPK